MGDASIVYLHRTLTVMPDNITNIIPVEFKVFPVAYNGALLPYYCVFAAAVCQNTQPIIDRSVFKQ